MGTNLSQVFVANTDALAGTGAFTTIDGTIPEIGIWKLDATADYINTKLFQTSFSPADTDTDGSDPAPSTSVDLANPAWLYNQLQFVQGTSGNPIASPVINTRDIRSITYTPYTAFVGTKATITDAKLGAVAAGAFQGNLKFIIKSTPTDHLNFYDPAGLNIFGDFPLGAFNTTNHKAINVTVNFGGTDAVDAQNAITSDIVARMAEHPILSKLFKAPVVSTDDIVIEAIHPGVVFDVIVTNVDNDSSTDLAITGQVLGSGNDWQVIGEEIRCRSRYGNFNRMYLPQHMEAFGKKGFAYDKIVIEYEHNWPTSTGIAPAGTLNQIVLYNTDTDGGAPVTTEGNYEAAFGITVGTAKKYIW